MPYLKPKVLIIKYLFYEMRENGMLNSRRNHVHSSNIAIRWWRWRHYDILSNEMDESQWLKRDSNIPSCCVRCTHHSHYRTLNIFNVHLHIIPFNWKVDMVLNSKEKWNYLKNKNFFYIKNRRTQRYLNFKFHEREQVFRNVYICSI